MWRNKPNFLKPASFQPCPKAAGTDCISCSGNLLSSARLSGEHHCPGWGGISHRKGLGRCSQVGLQQPREGVPLPAVPIKARLPRREQPVPSCTRHQKRKGWNSVQLNCECRGDPAEFVGTRGLMFILTPNFSPHPKTGCSPVMN